jgi:coenzyme F420 hydrogenase subunit beta
MNFNNIKKEDCFLCGGCQAVCPNDCLSIKERVLFKEDKCDDCGLCYNICAGSYFCAAEKSKIDDKSLGVYTDLFFSHAKDPVAREQGTSGGSIRALVKFLLDSRKVDGVIQIVNPDSTIKICCHDEDILPRRSIYTNIPLLRVLKELDPVKKYAIVGLPCHLQTLSKINNKNLFKNIKYRIGIFCGFNMEPRAITDVMEMIGITQPEVRDIDFRGGHYPGGLTFTLKNGKRISFSKKLYYFLDLLYLPKRCYYCCDFAAEESDISLGDALTFSRNRPNDDKKWNSLICRTEKGKNLIADAEHSNIIELIKTNKTELKKPFQFNITYKKHWLKMRLYLSGKDYLYGNLSQIQINSLLYFIYYPLHVAMSCMRSGFVKRIFKKNGRFLLRMFRL